MIPQCLYFHLDKLSKIDSREKKLHTHRCLQSCWRLCSFGLTGVIRYGDIRFETKTSSKRGNQSSIDLTFSVYFLFLFFLLLFLVDFVTLLTVLTASRLVGLVSLCTVYYLRYVFPKTYPIDEIIPETVQRRIMLAAMSMMEGMAGLRLDIRAFGRGSWLLPTLRQLECF